MRADKGTGLRARCGCGCEYVGRCAVRWGSVIEVFEVCKTQYAAVNEVNEATGKDGKVTSSL